MLQIINQDKILETLTWVFNRRNINQIAVNYDAIVIKFEPGLKSATLKDALGRLLWVTGHGYLKFVPFDRKKDMKKRIKENAEFRTNRKKDLIN